MEPVISVETLPTLMSLLSENTSHLMMIPNDPDLSSDPVYTFVQGRFDNKVPMKLYALFKSELARTDLSKELSSHCLAEYAKVIVEDLRHALDKLMKTSCYQDFCS